MSGYNSITHIELDFHVNDNMLATLSGSTKPHPKDLPNMTQQKAH